MRTLVNTNKQPLTLNSYVGVGTFSVPSWVKIALGTPYAFPSSTSSDQFDGKIKIDTYDL
jgi:hypothetical protein